MAAPEAWVLHDKFKNYLGAGGVKLATDNLKMALFSDASNVSITSIDAIGSATGELPTGNGYTAGGEVVTGQTWVDAEGVSTFDCDDLVWTAAGGSISARYAVLYDTSVVSPVAGPIVCHALLDSDGVDVVATDTKTLTVEISAAGVFNMS